MAFILVARSLAQASPLPAVKSVQEYGAEKLSQPIRWFATSVFAVLTAEETELEPQKVRWTPSFLPVVVSQVAGLALAPYAAPK